MSYQKQNFKTGDTLYASQLNIMEDGIINAENLAIEAAANMEKGTGKGSSQQLQNQESGVTEGYFNFVDKNPAAIDADPSLNVELKYGAVGDYSASLGGKSTAIGKRALSEGTTTVAKGAYSHAEGNATVALGANAHAEGAITTAFGSTSHAEGQNTQAKGENSHAEGMSTITEGRGSHSEGFATQAKGNYSHAEGCGSQALHDESHASGYYTKTGMPMQTVCGAYNVGRDNTFFEIGNGNKTKSENAFEVYTDNTIGIKYQGKTYSLQKILEALNAFGSNSIID